MGMSGILTLSVCPSGLRVGMMRVFGPFCRDFFVPWESIAVVRKTVLFWPTAKLQFGNPMVGRLSISAHVANRLARAAMGRWPETGPFPEETRGDTFRRLLAQWAVGTCVVAVIALFGVIAMRDNWSRLELARRECKENPLPDRDLNACITEKWLHRKVGESR